MKATVVEGGMRRTAAVRDGCALGWQRLSGVSEPPSTRRRSCLRPTSGSMGGQQGLGLRVGDESATRA